MGRKNTPAGKKEGRRGWESADPWGVGGNSGGRKVSVVGPDPHGVEWEEGGRKAYGVEKNPVRVRQGVEGGIELFPDDSTRHGEGGGGRVVTGRFDPQLGGGGCRVIEG